MATIQVPEPVRKLKRQYKARDLEGLSLAEDLVPVTIVDDLSGPGIADRGYPRACMGEVGIGGVAGEVGTAWWIPSGTAVVSRLDRLIITNATVDSYAFLLVAEGDAGLTSLTNSTLKAFTDLRVATETPNSFIQSRVMVPPVPGRVVGFVTVLGGVSQEFKIGAVGSIGGAFGVSNAVNDRDFQVTFFWTEYLVIED